MCAMKLLSFTPAAAPRVKLVTVEESWTVCEARTVKGPYDANQFLVPYFAGKDREHFVVLHLDAGHQPIAVEVVSIGTMNSAPVHPREVLKGAILANAQGIIAAHNHPTGDLQRSLEDHRVFERLKSAGALLGIPLLDFLVVADGKYRSIITDSTGGE